MSEQSNQPMLRWFHQRMAEKAADQSAAPILIVALGDSVTRGSTRDGVIEHDAVYHQQFKRLLETQFPTSIFSVINAGVDGESVSAGMARLDSDVVRHQPDLVLIAFGLNDVVSRGMEGLDEFAQTLTRMVRQIQSRTQADVILMTPNMMLSRSNQAVSPRWKAVEPRMMALQNDGVLARCARRIGEVARETCVPVVDVYAAWESLAAAGADTTALLANGLNHPTAEAHAIAARVLLKLIANPRRTPTCEKAL